LVKGCIVEIDAAPFRQWYEGHYVVALGRRHKKVEGEEVKTDASVEDPFTKTRSNHAARKIAERKEMAPVEQGVFDQFTAGRILARLSSRPGQSGRADGVILEGKELEFYMRKLKASKHK
jgi:small subunit ribosomal protein S8e